MNQQSADASNVRSLRGAQQGIFQQRFTQPGTLVLQVHGKPGQNHHRHRVLRDAFGQARCSLTRLHAANGQAVEANNRPGVATHIGLRGVGFLVYQRKALQKLVQRGLTAIESCDGIGSSQFANRLVVLRTQPSSPGSDSSFLSLGFARTGWSRAA